MSIMLKSLWDALHYFNWEILSAWKNNMGHNIAIS